MKFINKVKEHKDRSSTVVYVIEINGRILKFTYRTYNGSEKSEIEMFNSDEWKNLFYMREVGFEPDSSIYISSASVREKRCEEIFKSLVELCKKIIKN